MTITLYRNQILYDIANICYIEAKCAEYGAATQPHITGSHLINSEIINDACQDGNIDHISRIIGDMHAHAEELLFPLSRRNIASDLLDNLLTEPDTYVTHLHSQSPLSHTTLILLSRLLHQYIVYRTVAEWLSISHPSASAKWQEKSAIIASEIRSSVTSACAGAFKRRTSPL